MTLAAIHCQYGLNKAVGNKEIQEGNKIHSFILERDLIYLERKNFVLQPLHNSTLFLQKSLLFVVIPSIIKVFIPMLIGIRKNSLQSSHPCTQQGSFVVDDKSFSR